MRILIANPFGIGDVLFSLPLVHALRESFPKGFLGYLCNRRTEELVGCLKNVDWRLVFEKDEFRSAFRRSRWEGIQHLWGKIQAVRQLRFDGMLDLSMGWQYGLAGLLAGIPRRIGFDFRHRGRFLTDRVAIDGFHDQPVAEYYLDLLRFLGVPKPSSIRIRIEVPEAIFLKADRYLESLGVQREALLVGLVPGGGASWGPWATFKQWPPERFASVGDTLAQRYRAQVILIGDSKEAPLCQAVAAGMAARSFLGVEVPSLLVLAGILSRCRLVIGNDSGPMHLAAGVGVPTVTIFGPVDGSVYGPIGAQVGSGSDSHSLHRVVSHALACRPCYRGFRFPPCPWDNACLKRLEVSEVLEAVEEAMGRRSSNAMAMAR